jgi:hypothetical protein
MSAIAQVSTDYAGLGKQITPGGVVAQRILEAAMKALNALMLWILLVGCGLCFAIGHHWYDMGSQLEWDSTGGHSSYRDLGRAIWFLGLFLEVLGAVGLLAGLSYVGLLLSMKRCERRMRRLNEQIQWLEEVLDLPR